MAKKETQQKKKVFNFDASPMVKTTEQTVVAGYQRLESEEEQGGGEPQPSIADVPIGPTGRLQRQERRPTEPAPVTPAQEITAHTAAEQGAANVRQAMLSQQQSATQKAGESTKGIQTYIPMSMYRRLNDMKLTRGETIGNLVAEAVAFWLDVQEGCLLYTSDAADE